MVVFAYYPMDVRVRREVEALVQSGMGVDIICLMGEREQRKGEFNKVSFSLKLNRVSFTVISAFKLAP